MNEISNKFSVLFIAGHVFIATGILLLAIAIANLSRPAPSFAHDIENTIIAAGQKADVFILDRFKQSRQLL